MNSPEQNKTVRLLKTKGRRSSSSSGSSYGSGTSLGSPITRRPMGSKKPKAKRFSKGKKKLKVLDADGADVTPQPLTQTDPDAPKRTMFFLDEGSDSETELGKTDSPTLLCSFTTTTFHVDNAVTTQYTAKDSLTSEPEESLSVFEMQRPIRFQQEEAESVKEVTDEMLEDFVNICLTETETISLLDIPGRVLSVDAEGAAALKESNSRYIKLCKGKPGNDKFVERSMQTFDKAPKSKRIQTDTVVTVETGTSATNWDIYDSFHELIESSTENDNTESLTRTLSQSSKERQSKSSSTTGTGSTISSLPDIDLNGDGSQNGPDLQTVMQSKEFRHSLLIMERNVVANIFQSKLATYRELPILHDPYSSECKIDIPKERKGHPQVRTEESRGVLIEETPLAPTLNHLWSFTCDLTQDCVVTCMAWHKESPDILAVGYNSSAVNSVNPGLICVWSLKNPTWPERVLYTHNAVTSLDFSQSSPSQIGVGMNDGTVALYNVADRQCVANSIDCSKKHDQQVCLVRWSNQESEVNREEQEEVLVSVSADGLIKKWFLSTKGLDCTDLFQLRNVKNTKKEPVSNKKKTQNVLRGGVAPGLCFDFHPVDSSVYLAGTREGLIHMCSFSNRQYYLETYDKHFRPVNNIEWSPFSPDVFLSCSSDWTVQLWRRDKHTPVMGFTSSQSAVHTVRWSPKWPTVFAALKGEQLEIWDLKSSILDPVIVLRSAADVELTALLFSKEVDAVLLGDSEGEVKVYQLNNISAGRDQQVKLEDTI